MLCKELHLTLTFCGILLYVARCQTHCRNVGQSVAVSVAHCLAITVGGKRIRGHAVEIWCYGSIRRNAESGQHVPSGTSTPLERREHVDTSFWNHIDYWHLCVLVAQTYSRKRGHKGASEFGDDSTPVLCLFSSNGESPVDYGLY